MKHFIQLAVMATLLMGCNEEPDLFAGTWELDSASRAKLKELKHMSYSDALSIATTIKIEEKSVKLGQVTHPIIRRTADTLTAELVVAPELASIVANKKFEFRLISNAGGGHQLGLGVLRYRRQQ